MELEARILREQKRRERARAFQTVLDLGTIDPERSFRLFCESVVLITTKEAGEGRIPFMWNPIQERLNADRSGRDAVLKARQVGMTTNELARDAWFALTKPHTAVCVVVQPHKTSEPSRKIRRQIETMLEAVWKVSGAKWQGTTLTFDNGSILTIFDAGGSEGSADKQGRGGTYHRIHLTETAFYPYADAVIAALLNGLPDVEHGGELTEESTPNGASGVFYQHCMGAQAGSNGMKLHFFPWFMQQEYRKGKDESPASPDDGDEEELIKAAESIGLTLSASQLRWWREQRSLKGHDRTVQEYPHDPHSCFLLSGTCYFDMPSLVRLEALCGAPRSLDGLTAIAGKDSPAKPFQTALCGLLERVNRAGGNALRVWEPPMPGGRYLVVCDTSLGKAKSDWLVAMVFHQKTLEHVATLRAKMPIARFTHLTHQLAKAYGGALVAPERNNMGHTMVHILVNELHYPHMWLADPEKPDDVGFWTGAHNRMSIIDDLVDAVTQRLFKTKDLEFVSECKSFVRKPDGRIEAEGTEHDDMVMAAAIAWRILCGPRIHTTSPAIKPNTLNPFG
jgi:hypothetical protein